MMEYGQNIGMIQWLILQLLKISLIVQKRLWGKKYIQIYGHCNKLYEKMLEFAL